MDLRFLRFVWAALLANVLVLGALAVARDADPIYDVRITTQQDAVIVFGRNYFGLMNVQIFPDWSSAQNYLTKRGFHMPLLSYAERGVDPTATIERTTLNPRNPIQSRSYCLTWNRNVATARGVVLLTPDAPSALAMLDYVRHSGFVPSSFGFSLPVD